MAAVLCKGCGDVCTGCAKICVLPCKILSEATSCLCSNPFCLYIVTTLAFNVPPIATAVFPLISSFLGCRGSLWLLVNVILCAINIGASIYVAMKYKDPNQEESSGFHRAKNILCYDPVVAIYMLILIGFFIWLCVGVSWMVSGQMQSGDDYFSSCASETESAASTSIGLGFAFFGVGFFALCISLCCTCIMNDPSGEDNTVYQIPSQQQNNNNQGAAKNYGTGAASKPVASAVPVYNPEVPVYAEVVQPSAPPAATQNGGLDDEAKAAASGVKLGGKLGKLMKTSDETTTKLETMGAKASVAANKGFNAVKKMAGISRPKDRS